MRREGRRRGERGKEGERGLGKYPCFPMEDT